MHVSNELKPGSADGIVEGDSRSEGPWWWRHKLILSTVLTLVERTSGPATDLAYRLVLAVDAPTNACPSMHASLGLSSALWCHRLLSGCGAAWLWRAGLWAWTTGILYATLTLRQYLLADLLAGRSLAAVVYAMSGRWGLWRRIGRAVFTRPRSFLRATDKSAG
jgi:hypothetical protein